VRLVRGSAVSRNTDDILQEVEGLIVGGYKEIVLTGICIGSWKGEHGERFSDLLKMIERINGEFRVRISSIEPNHVTNDLIEVMASSDRLCRHLHIPLQSGSDRILRSMRRKYDLSQFFKIIEEVRSKMPYAGITTDIIAGFPGEGESDFNMTVDAVNRITPSRIHVFKYSDRKGTSAYSLAGKIPDNIAKKRVQDLINIGKNMQKTFAMSFIGKNVEVLIEKKMKSSIMTGYTREYVQIFTKDPALKAGDLFEFKPLALGSKKCGLMC